MFVAAVLAGFQTWSQLALGDTSFIVPPAAAGCSTACVFLILSVNLERQFYAQLRGKRYTNGCARPEKIAERAGGGPQLARTGNRPGKGAIGVQAKRGGVGKIVDRHRQRGNIRNKVVTRIVTVEQVEKLREWRNRPAIVKGKRTADAQIQLRKRTPAKLIERRLHAVHHGAIAHRSRQRIGPRAF